MKRAAAAKSTYLDAVKDWARKGAASRFAFDPETARAHVAETSEEAMLAHAKFQLGRHLARSGRFEEAEALFAECRELHPDSWNIFRETTEKMDTGIAAGEAFWTKVMSLGEKQYYASVDMDGMP